MSRAHPPAEAHGEIRPLFEDVYFVSGAVSMRAGITVRFSRNMVIVREGRRLVLINSMRLSEAGLAELDALGEVTDVIRIAGFHGKDDPFYAERYDAKVWAVRGQTYFKGVDPETTAPPYFEAHHHVEATDDLPLQNASLFVVEATPPEGLLLLEREGGILVSGDCLQNWDRVDEYFSFLGGVMMRMMGFLKPTNLGPGWLRGAKPNRDDIRKIPQLDFKHVLPAHGAPVLDRAREAYGARIARLR